MAVGRSRKRAIRLAVILPPLLSLTLVGYWRFLGSPAMRSLMAAVLGRTLGASVTIGGHELTRPSRIDLSDLQMEFLAEGRPSGVRFNVRKASAHAARLLGIGPFKELVLEDPEARLRGLQDGAGPALSKLALFRTRRGRAAVRRVEFRNMALAFEIDGLESGGRAYRVGGIDLGLDFSGESLRMSADLGEFCIEGAESRVLEEEKPDITFGVEITKSEVAVRQLSVKGRSGWTVDGDVHADLSGDVPQVRGELQLRDLKISRIRELRISGMHKPPSGISVRTPTGESAVIRRTIRFEGTTDDLCISADTDVPEFIYADEALGLTSEGTMLKSLRREMRTSLADLLRGLLEKDTKVRYNEPVQSGPQRRPRHADRAVPGGTPGVERADAQQRSDATQ